ncbi:unnamed protein product [Fusarium graminearum]|nr:unnamed protein product [Fusarium graminearum]CAG1960036.1 unnamed protein product [Fusarium graminearum]CAG1975103.1 unnamed protein product [Fusarium graminearum]VTO84336.1 unnamed protein product [Fusarium graminearum]
MNDNAESIHFYASGYLRTDSTIETDLTSVVPGPSVTGAWVCNSRITKSRDLIRAPVPCNSSATMTIVHINNSSVFGMVHLLLAMNSDASLAVSSYHNIVGATSFLYNAFCHRETDKIFALCSSCIINHVMFTSKDYGMLV